jgi:hypothetical protein
MRSTRPINLRLAAIVVAASALIPAVATAHPAGPLPADKAGADDQIPRRPVLVREADGSITIREILPAFPAGLERGGLFRIARGGATAVGFRGRRKSLSEEAVDADLERAFGEAQEMARFGAPN